MAASETVMGAVLVLGAEGFIGRAVRQALAPDHRLLSVDIRPLTPVVAYTGFLPAGGERLLRFDLGDPGQIASLWREIGEELPAVDGIVHLAAYYDFTNRDDPRYHRLHAALPELLTRVAADVPRGAPLLHASSMASLAPAEPGHRLGPESPRLGAWAYPHWKLETERTLEAAGLPQPVAELVLAAVYSDLCELVPLYQQIERIRRRSVEARLYPGPSDRGLTYVHVDDVAAAFSRALQALRGRPGIHRMLVGEGEPLTYGEVHRRATQVFRGRPQSIRRVPRFLARLGAALLGIFAGLRRRRRFLLPWMVRFAGEHFEFELEHTERLIGWRPRRRVHVVLDRMLQVARYHPRLWVQVNERRPW